MRSLLLVSLVSLAGCASTPQQLASTPTGSLCVRYATALLNPNREAWLREVYRRGETCAPYAAEMATAGAQAQSSLNSLNQRYAPAPVAPQSPGVTAFLKNSYVQGTSRICMYDAMGSPHVITVRSVDICPLSVKK